MGPIERKLFEVHGVDLREYLFGLYVASGLSIRQIAKVVGYTDGTGPTERLLRKYSVPLRHGSEAVAGQWRNNQARRDAAGLAFAAAHAKRKAEGIPNWNLGHTKETHPGVASMAKKFRDRRWTQRPEAMKKAVTTKRALHRADPSTHGLDRVGPSRIECIFLDWLRNSGRDVVFQKPFVLGDELFFVDFFLPGANLAIELTQDTNRVPPARLQAFFEHGIPMMAIPNFHVVRREFARMEDPISRAERGEFHPSTIGECWVLRRSAAGMTAVHQADMKQRLGGWATKKPRDLPEAPAMREDEVA